MNLLFSCIGRRGYLAEYFRPHLKSNDKIIGTSSTKWTPGFAACDEVAVLPSINDPRYVPAVLHLCREKKVNALFSFFDEDVHILSKHIPTIRSLGVVPFLPDNKISNICFDKLLTHQFLSSNGFHSPKTWIDLIIAVRALKPNDYPVYVKPRRGFSSINTFLASNAHELNIFFRKAPDMIIQRTLQGQEYGLDILNSLDKNVLEVVPRKKLAIRAGETDQAVSVKHKELILLGKKLGDRLGHVGPLDVDVFVDEGRISILELNPRFGGGYPVSQLAGADFPGLLVKMLRGEHIEHEMGSYRDGVVMMKDYRVVGGWLEDDFPKGAWTSELNVQSDEPTTL